MAELQKELLVVVTPVYEDAEVATRLFREIADSLGHRVYIVAVDDGSVRQPLDIASIEQAGLDGVVVSLKRNVGHQRAIAIGLCYVSEKLPQARRVVVMDSDGEDVPESIKDLLVALDSKEVDLVVAVRKSRVETLKFRLFYVLYKILFWLLTGRKINFGNFMALKSNALKRLVSMQELWVHVAGCALTSKLRMTTRSIDRGPRYGGASKMNFVALALHGFKGLMVFAEDVLVRVGLACAMVAAMSVVAGAVAISLKILGFATPGWFSVALGLLFLVFLQTGALTLTTLMLTGVVKGVSVPSIEYEGFVDSVRHAKK